MTTVACLMVKNESAVIERCLNSLKGMVNRIILVDTGSTDDTVKRATDTGLIYAVDRQPWVDFGTNRTSAFAVAGEYGDYVLIVDADQTMEGEFDFRTGADAYNIMLHHGDLRYPLPRLLKATKPWRWDGATHECLLCSEPFTKGLMPSLIQIEHADSHRRKTDKTEDDIRLLEKQVAESVDPRAVFYLARSYDDAGRREAREVYEQRLLLGGYEEEKFYSLYRIGMLSGQDDYLMRAWQMRPERWEPVAELCRRLNVKQQYRVSNALSTAVLAHAQRSAYPEGLFVHRPAYDYGLKLEHSISCYYLGKKHEGAEACIHVLQANPPMNIRAAVERNLKFYA